MTTYKSIKYNISGADLTGLTAGQIPNLDTAKITTGTMADARISSSSVVQHSPETDLRETTSFLYLPIILLKRLEEIKQVYIIFILKMKMAKDI